MVNKLYTFCAILNRGLERLLAVLGLSMAFLVVMQVFYRYILNSSLFWSEELARYMLVWLSFIGAIVAYFRQLHPGVDLFTARLSPAWQYLARRFAHLVTMALALVMIISGSRFAWFVRMQISPALAIPKWIILAIIPASGLILLLFALTFFSFLKNRISRDYRNITACIAGLFALNIPIAIAIGASAVLALALQGDFPLMMVAQRMFSGTDSFHLMAVPLFMFAGVLMDAGGISKRIIDFANALVGWLPGGLAAVTIVSAMFFAGISGSAAADAAAVGAVLIPAMKRSGYESDFAAAVQAAGGSIGVIIPPSIPMIIFGFLTGASIGRLFAAGILPGMLIGGSLITVATLVSVQQGYSAAKPFSLAEVRTTAKRALLAMGAPIIILGGILTGIFTATESAAVAVLYALIVGMFIYRQIRPNDLFPLFTQGAITSAIVMFIIAMASIFSWIAAIDEIPQQLAGALLSITDNPTLLILLINLVLLIAGTFIETTASLILLVPMITAMLPALHIDLIQLGVIVVTNLAIGMLTPPWGSVFLFLPQSPETDLALSAKKVLPFLAILLVDLLIISFYAPLTMLMAGFVSH